MVFRLLFVFGVIPFTIGLAIIGLVTRKKIYGKIIGFIFLAIAALLVLVSVMHVFTSKKEIKREDIYGTYVIDRTKFAGKQADWQYNHFRFTIKDNNRCIFYLTDGERVVKKYTGHIIFVDGFASPHIIFHMDETSHHILENNPTLYREVWGFYYVFNSPKFGNVFFKKGEWKEIEDKR